MSAPAERVAVVGAGIAGLACAWRLAGAGADVVVLEAANDAGGTLRTVRDGPYQVELGPNTVPGTAELVALAEEVGLTGELLEAERGLARFIFHGGRLHAVPMKLAAMATTSLLSSTGKLAVLGEAFVPRRKSAETESVADFVVRRFGREVLDHVFAPMIAGTFAGDAAALELESVFPKLAELEAAHGSVVRGALLGGREGGGSASSRTILSFRSGLQALPRRLAERLGPRLRLGTRVDALGLREGGVELRTESGESVAASSVVVALEPWHAAAVLSSALPDVAAELAAIAAPPLALVAVAVPRRAVAHDLRGFGFLAAPDAGCPVLGAVFASALFPDRAPADEALFVAFVGGATDATALAADDAALIARAQAGLGEALGVTASPLWSRVERYPRSIAQYALGHRARLARIRAGLAVAPRLRLAGHYLSGISVGESLRSGLVAAESLLGGKP